MFSYKLLSIGILLRDNVDLVILPPSIKAPRTLKNPFIILTWPALVMDLDFAPHAAATDIDDDGVAVDLTGMNDIDLTGMKDIHL